jgi:GNAT superfamily N-acetyltransferase|tara:strand:- start:4965 stop:5411 length:447 start_codon:yes stop_codon:yes gene_type:complete
MIRDLTQADVPQLLHIARSMHVESVYKDYALHEERTEYILCDLILNTSVYSKGVVLNDELIGVFLGEVSTDLWTDVQVARDIILYVLPEHRSGGQGVRLLKSFKEWAAPRADEIVISVFAGIENATLGHILDRMGYIKSGTLHMMRAA